MLSRRCRFALFDRSLTRKVIALAVIVPSLIFSAGGVGAQERTDRMARLMAYLPATMLQPEVGLSIRYHDVDAARNAIDRPNLPTGEPTVNDQMSWTAYLRLSDLPADITDSVVYGFRGEWDNLVGFRPGDITAMLSVENPPTLLTLMELSEDVELIAVMQALVANGYEAEQADAWSTWWRGEDFTLDPERIDWANPFGGALGRSARIATDGSVLAYAPAWPVVRSLIAGAEPRLDQVPAVAALLEALDDPRFGTAELVQATLLPVPWPAVSPAAAPSSGDTDSDVGLPPWRLGILADLSSGEIDHAVAALVYDDRDKANGLAGPLLDAWHTQHSSVVDRTFADLAGGTADTYVVGDGPAVLVLSIARPMGQGDYVPRNLAYHFLTSAHRNADLSILGVR